jgi:DNA-binding PadR family transcriptional regulator
MAEAARPRLSLAEWLVLCLVCEQPTYGLALAQLLGRDGSLGQVWSVPKAMIYRDLSRLEALGLVRVAGQQRSDTGPVRSLYKVTGRGRTAAADWLTRPVRHPREVRSELLVKLALLDRAGADPSALVRAQLDELRPIAAALDQRLSAANGFDRTVALWRHESMAATMRFLQSVTSAPAGQGW